MKRKLYQKQVIEGEKRQQELLKGITDEYGKKVVLLIVSIIIACLLNVLVTIILSKYTSIPAVSILLVPIIVKVTIPRVNQLRIMHFAIKMLKIDKSVYRNWIDMHKSKITDESVLSACSIFLEYRNNYLERHEELSVLLKGKLKKPSDPIVVSVVAGLIFLCNRTSDYDILFNARYKHGPAGSMIPEIWIKLLSSDASDYSKVHSECAEEFISFWDEKCLENKKSST